jgi:hypothetical protein
MAGFAYGLGTGISGAEQASQQNLTNQEHLAQMQSQQLQNQQLQTLMQGKQKLSQMLLNAGGDWTPEIRSFALGVGAIDPQQFTSLAQQQTAREWVQNMLSTGIGPTGQPITDEEKFAAAGALKTGNYDYFLKISPMAEKQAEATLRKGNADASTAEQQAQLATQKGKAEINELNARGDLSGEQKRDLIAKRQSDIDLAVANAKKARAEIDNFAAQRQSEDEKAADDEYYKNKSWMDKLYGVGPEAAATHRQIYLMQKGYDVHQVFNNAPPGSTFLGLSPEIVTDHKTGRQMKNKLAGHPMIQFPNGERHTTNAAGVLD